jgi:hypothetical protein
VRGFIDPRIDGLVTSYYEWYQAAQLDIKKTGGSMHKSESIMSSFYYGFNKDNLFLRVDPALPFPDFPEHTSFAITIFKPSQSKIITYLDPPVTSHLLRKKDETWEKIKDITDVAARDIFEIKIPFADLDVREKDEISLCITILKNGEEIERCPWRGYITITVPTPDFEAMLWY